MHLAVVLVQWFRSGTVRRTREGQNGGSSEKPAPPSASDGHRSGAATRNSGVYVLFFYGT